MPFKYFYTAIAHEYVNPCQPSPCGPNSQCRESNGVPICSCLPEYVGSPPACRPECVVSSECPSDKACVNQKCKDPCPNVCGTNADCRVNNHSPICTCRNGFTGNPFTRCNPIPRKLYRAKCELQLRWVIRLLNFSSSRYSGYSNEPLRAISLWP